MTRIKAVVAKLLLISQFVSITERQFSELVALRKPVIEATQGTILPSVGCLARLHVSLNRIAMYSSVV